MTNQKAIIVGASSGIGKALAEILSRNKYEVGLCARRLALLEDLQKTLPSKAYVKQLDISQPELACQALEELINEMHGTDLVILSAGIGYENPELEWDKEQETIQVNVEGFAAIGLKAFNHFSEKNGGHLVGISSIAALRGMGDAPVYSASKAFVSNFLQGLCYRAKKSKKDIHVTNIEPGFVDTAMAKGEGLFWVAPPELAAKQIFNSIQKKKKHAYVTKRWRIMAWIMKILPDWMYCKI